MLASKKTRQTYLKIVYWIYMPRDKEEKMLKKIIILIILMLFTYGGFKFVESDFFNDEKLIFYLKIN